MKYDYNDIKRAYKNIGISKSLNLLIEGKFFLSSKSAARIDAYVFILIFTLNKTWINNTYIIYL